MRNDVNIFTVAMICAIFTFALSADAAQFTPTHHSSNTGAGSGVTRAEFEKLQGQVQVLEGRVSALERMSGHSGRTGGHTGKTSGDSWINH